jgi:hypothetical protein
MSSAHIPDDPTDLYNRRAFAWAATTTVLVLSVASLWHISSKEVSSAAKMGRLVDGGGSALTSVTYYL